MHLINLMVNYLYRKYFLFEILTRGTHHLNQGYTVSHIIIFRERWTWIGIQDIDNDGTYTDVKGNALHYAKFDGAVPPSGRCGTIDENEIPKLKWVTSTCSGAQVGLCSIFL